MSKWLKENWFKLLIALGIIIVVFSVGYYYFLYLPKVNDLKLQEMCANDAQKFFDNQHYEQHIQSDNPLGVSESHMYTNHYNKKLNQCFALVNGYQTFNKNDWRPKESTITNTELYNVYERKIPAMCTGTFSEDSKSYDCFINRKESNNWDGFQAFVNSYMNE